MVHSKHVWHTHRSFLPWLPRIQIRYGAGAFRQSSFRPLSAQWHLPLRLAASGCDWSPGGLRLRACCTAATTLLGLGMAKRAPPAGRAGPGDGEAKRRHRHSTAAGNCVLRPPPRPSPHPSEVLRAPPHPSEVLRPPPRPSEVLRPPPRPSEVLRPPPRPSEAQRPPPRGLHGGRELRAAWLSSSSSGEHALESMFCISTHKFCIATAERIIPSTCFFVKKITGSSSPSSGPGIVKTAGFDTALLKRKVLSQFGSGVFAIIWIIRKV